MAASQRGKLGHGFSILEIWKSVGEREYARVRLSALVEVCDGGGCHCRHVIKLVLVVTLVQGQI